MTHPDYLPRLGLALMLFLSACQSESLPVVTGLILDLDADLDLTVENDDRIVGWRNQVPDSPVQWFVPQEKGREVPGSGRPSIRRQVGTIDGHDTVVFRQQELVNDHESAFDALATGAGYTWFSVMAVYEQRVGLEDVNSFFGNLRNGGNYEGIWGNFTDDNTVWIGSRNGITFGRFDANNPKLLGSKLEIGPYYVVAGRMASGSGRVPIEVFVNEPEVIDTVLFPVNPDADASRMAIGQERDAIEHPGVESFDGEITRFLIFERPLPDEELDQVMAFLRQRYGIRGR